jgi:DNA-binding transcriptional regulator YbjK
MENKQQTAVEWLVEQLLKQGAMKVISNTTYYFDEKVVEQAFKMFEEQMVEHSFNFYYDLSNKKGVPFNLISENRILAEDYYNETHKK